MLFQSGHKQTTILLSGKTGVGKSSLVNALLGQDIAAEGHTLDPETSEVSYVTEVFFMHLNSASHALWNCLVAMRIQANTTEKASKKRRQLLTYVKDKDRSRLICREQYTRSNAASARPFTLVRPERTLSARLAKHKWSTWNGHVNNYIAEHHLQTKYCHNTIVIYWEKKALREKNLLFLWSVVINFLSRAN